ncbi:MAG: hypothetical protein ACOYNO_08855 [Saprospiraceae bacterium]
MTNLKTIQTSIFALFILLVLTATKCCDPSSCEDIDYCNCAVEEPPIQIIIGEDVSGSFTKFKHIEPSQIERLCDILGQKNRGAQITFIAVGNHNPSGFVSCSIDIVPEKEDDASFTQKNKCQRLIKERQAKNQKSIAAFIKNCEALLKQDVQKYTDINSFLKKASRFVNSSGKSYENIVYINCDGKHESVDRTPLDCANFPDGASVYASGWVDPNICNLTSESIFPAPEEFLQFMEKELTVGTLSTCQNAK